MAPRWARAAALACLSALAPAGAVGQGAARDGGEESARLAASAYAAAAEAEAAGDARTAHARYGEALAVAEGTRLAARARDRLASLERAAGGDWITLGTLLTLRRQDAATASAEAWATTTAKVRALPWSPPGISARVWWAEAALRRGDHGAACGMAEEVRARDAAEPATLRTLARLCARAMVANGDRAAARRALLATGLGDDPLATELARDATLRAVERGALIAAAIAAIALLYAAWIGRRRSPGAYCVPAWFALAALVLVGGPVLIGGARDGAFLVPLLAWAAGEGAFLMLAAPAGRAARRAAHRLGIGALAALGAVAWALFVSSAWHERLGVLPL